MKPFKTDIAVAMIFFNRPDTLQKVFDSVAEARPSKLYLIQDGARENKPSDKEKIKACRDIVSHVDWDCQVEKLYSDVNLGCGKRIFSGLSTVFDKEEYACIVEDDIVIGESFLPFCKEMCERYKDDQRIQMISGMNHLGVYEDCPYDYCFSRFGGAIWGWATWRRCWQELDWELSIVTNPYYDRLLCDMQVTNMKGAGISAHAKRVRANILKGINPTYWSMHFGIYQALSGRLNIVPKYNLISNIGLTADSAHATDSIKKIPKRLRVVFFGKIYKMPATLKHPEYVVDDQYYKEQQEKIMNPSKLKKFIEIPERIYQKFFC